MDRLSTELDEKIVQHLVGREASALSMTSKYYRSLAEPQLYQHLKFSMTKQYISLWLLSETLFGRQDLAKHIRSFTLTGGGIAVANPEFEEAFFRRLRNEYGSYKSFIDDIVPPSSRFLATRWCERMFTGAPIIDGQLAIILCLAQNMERLVYVYPRFDHLAITHEVRRMCWPESRMTRGSIERMVLWKLSKDTAQRADDNTSSHPHSADLNEM